MLEYFFGKCLANALPLHFWCLLLLLRDFLPRKVGAKKREEEEVRDDERKEEETQLKVNSKGRKRRTKEEEEEEEEVPFFPLPRGGG